MSLLHFPNETLHQSVHTLSLSISLITETLLCQFVTLCGKLSWQHVMKINHQIAYGIPKRSYCWARYKQASNFTSEFNTTISDFSTCFSHTKLKRSEKNLRLKESLRNENLHKKAKANYESSEGKSKVRFSQLCGFENVKKSLKYQHFASPCLR